MVVGRAELVHVARAEEGVVADRGDVAVGPAPEPFALGVPLPLLTTIARVRPVGGAVADRDVLGNPEIEQLRGCDNGQVRHGAATLDREVELGWQTQDSSEGVGPALRFARAG